MISDVLFVFICACFGVLHLVEKTWGLYHPPTRYTATSLPIAKIRVYDDAEIVAYARARRALELAEKRRSISTEILAVEGRALELL